MFTLSGLIPIIANGAIIRITVSCNVVAVVVFVVAVVVNVVVSCRNVYIPGDSSRAPACPSGDPLPTLLPYHMYT